MLKRLLGGKEASALPVLKLGNPLLRQKCLPLEKAELSKLHQETSQLLEQMNATMEAEDGVGLAASQIGVLKRVFIAGTKSMEEKSGLPDLPVTTFLNPQVKIHGLEKFTMWEACLSLPTLAGKITRPAHITVNFFNEHGKEAAIEAYGFYAAVLQHEYDHLDGILYVDRLQSSKDLIFAEEIRPPLPELDGWYRFL